MIKKNDIKLKPSGKRLFSEISAPSFASNPNTPNVNFFNNNNNFLAAKTKSTDEADGNRANFAKISPMSSFINRPNNNFLNSVVGSRQELTSSPNLVTMVIGNSQNQTPLISTFLNSPNNNNNNININTNNNSSIISSASILPVSTSFTRKLQNIQSERLN